jgi:hypothetical protein
MILITPVIDMTWGKTKTRKIKYKKESKLKGTSVRGHYLNCKTKKVFLLVRKLETVPLQQMHMESIHHYE